MEKTLKKRIFLQASPAKVWDYLTEPAKLATWFHKPSADLSTGPYEMFGVQSGERLMWGEVLRAEPYSLLEYSFQINPMGDQSSVVRWVLSEVAGGTQLDLEHEGLPQAEEAYGLTLALDKGWDDHLARLREDAHTEAKTGENA